MMERSAALQRLSSSLEESTIGNDTHGKLVALCIGYSCFQLRLRAGSAKEHVLLEMQWGGACLQSVLLESGVVYTFQA